VASEEAVSTQWAPADLAAGETDWDAVYAEALPRVYNFFRYRVGPGAMAEDLTSVTFLKAWDARRRYRRDRAGFTTWLFVIARRVAIDHYRRPRREAPLEAAATLAAADSAEAAAERRSDLERLANLLESLAPRERELIALKYGAELTNRAIARLTGLGESNVGTILHRAIIALKERW
jgi:RNA polymerase sigma-70 factor (ECF subfamily)